MASGGSAGSGGRLGMPQMTPSTASFSVDYVTTWRGDAKGAYSIIHDDLCDASVGGLFDSANTELHQRGLRAGFGAIVGACDGALEGSEVQWPQVKELVANGHEIFSHSWSHACLAPDSPHCGGAGSTDYATEIDKAHSTLEAKLGGGYHEQFFISLTTPGAMGRFPSSSRMATWGRAPASAVSTRGAFRTALR